MAFSFERKMFEFTSRIRYSETDSNEQLNIFGIVNYFQDCSNMQSEDLGGGIDILHEKNMAWVLCSWNIEVRRYPKLGEYVTVGTFPYEYKGYFGKRNYYMKDENGNIIACADSLWSLINYDEGRAIRIPEEIASVYTVEPPLEMEYTKGKILLPEKLDLCGEIKVLPHHLDANMHVNNARFLEMVLDVVPNKSVNDESGTIAEDASAINYPSRLRTEYRSMAKKGEILNIYAGKYEDKNIIVLKNNDSICTMVEMK